MATASTTNHHDSLIVCTFAVVHVLYFTSLIPRPPLAAFFSVVEKTRCFFWFFSTAAKKAARGGLGTRLIFYYFPEIMDTVSAASCTGFLYTGTFYHPFVQLTQYIAPLQADFNPGLNDTSRILILSTCKIRVWYMYVLDSDLHNCSGNHAWRSDLHLATISPHGCLWQVSRR